MSKTGLVLVVLLGLCASEMLRGPKVMIEEEQSIFETEQEDQSYYIPNMQGSEMDITLQSDANGIDTSLAVFQEEKDPFVEIQEAKQGITHTQFKLRMMHNTILSISQNIMLKLKKLQSMMNKLLKMSHQLQIRRILHNNLMMKILQYKMMNSQDMMIMRVFIIQQLEQQNDDEPQAQVEEEQAVVDDEPQAAAIDEPQAAAIDEPQAAIEETQAAIDETQESAEIAAIPSEEARMSPSEPYHFKQPRQFQDEQQFEDNDMIAPKKGPEVVLKLHPAEESAKPLQPPQAAKKHIYIYNPLAKKPFMGIKFPPMKVTKEVNYLGSFDMSNMKLPVWSGESNHRLDDELEFFQFIRTSDISLNEY